MTTVNELITETDPLDISVRQLVLALQETGGEHFTLSLGMDNTDYSVVVLPNTSVDAIKDWFETTKCN